MSPDIRELFSDAADDSQRAQLDANALLARGRRKVRVRRAGAALGTGVLAAAAVVAIAQFPRPQAGVPVPPADTPRISAPQSGSPPVPSTPLSAGTPSGDTSATPSSPGPSTTLSEGATPRTIGPPESAAQTSGAELIRKLSYAEAVRRCTSRMEAEYGAAGTPVPVVIGPGESHREGMYVTDLLQFRMPDGSSEFCSVPGPVRPAYGEVAEGKPGDARQECGRLTWTNLTSWTVAEQRDSDGGLAATLLSPDRQAALLCDVDAPGATRDKASAFPDAYVFLVYGPQSGERVGGAPNGAIGSGLDSPPIRWLGSVKDGRRFWGGGGFAKQGATRYVLSAGSRVLAESPVRYGIYAMRVWLPAGAIEPTRVRGYDASGTVVDEYGTF
jgi:hypothetical protein